MDKKKILSKLLPFLRGCYLIFTTSIITRVLSSKFENEPLVVNFDWFFWAMVLLGGLVIPHLDKPKKESSPAIESKSEV